MYSGKQKHLHELINIAGWIWNHCVALQKRHYKLFGKKASSNDLQKHIAKLRNRNSVWKKLDAQTVQDICQRVEKSYQAFFSWCKKKTGARKSPPKFRKSNKYKSITFKQNGFKLSDNKFTINSIGKTFKFFKSRYFGKPRRITIKRDSCGDFWIIVMCEIEREKISYRTGKTIGLDFSMPKFLVSNDNGLIIPNARFFNDFEKQIAKANQEVSRKKKGSNNRKKAKLKLAKLHRKIERKRNYFQWKIANFLVQRYDVLTFEHLNLDAFKKLWGKKVSDWAFGEFLKKIEYLCWKYDKEFFQADRWFPSSKLCSCCGHKKEKLELSEREYICTNCGSVMNRDKNASTNLDNLGKIMSNRIVDVSLDIPSNLRACAKVRA